MPRENLDQNCEDQPHTDAFYKLYRRRQAALIRDWAVLWQERTRFTSALKTHSRRDEAAVGRGYFPLFSHVRTRANLFLAFAVAGRG